MATKVHHKYKVGEIVDTLGSDVTVRDANGVLCFFTGVAKIVKQAQRNNRPYYLIEFLHGVEYLISQSVITMYCDIDPPKEDSPPVVDRSSKIRESLEDLCTAATTSPIRDKIVELLAVELDTLHTDIAILTEKEAKLLDLMAKVKNL